MSRWRLAVSAAVADSLLGDGSSMKTTTATTPASKTIKSATATVLEMHGGFSFGLSSLLVSSVSVLSSPSPVSLSIDGDNVGICVGVVDNTVGDTVGCGKSDGSSVGLVVGPLDGEGETPREGASVFSMPQFTGQANSS